MSWSAGFKNKLKKLSIAPIYELVFHNLPLGPGGNYTIYGGQEPFMVQNPKTKSLRIKKSGPSISGCGVIPGRWNVTFGGFDVPIQGNIKGLFPDIRRGAFASLYVILDGVKERVAFGQLKSITGVKDDWLFSFIDMVGALATNCDGGIVNANLISLNNPIPYGKFFYRAGQTTTTNATYSMGGNTISVSRLDDFEKSYAVDGLAKVEIAGHGTAFFEWTAKSAASGAGTLTLTTASKGGSVIYPGDLALTNIPSGSTVTALVRLKGKPWELLPYILFSKDGDRSEPFDEYPRSWSAFGNFPADVWDENDAAVNNNRVVANPTTTSYAWNYTIEEPLTSGFRELTDLFANVGLWPVWRQNAMSFRCAVDPRSQNIAPVIEITDSEIIRVESQELFSAENPAVYSAVKFIYGTGATDKYVTASTANRAPSLPFEGIYEIDQQFIYDPTTGTAKSQMARGDVDRIKGWTMNSIEIVQITVGIEYAKLCAGDIVAVTSEYIFNQTQQQRNGWLRMRAMVVDISYSFSTRECNLRLATYFPQW